MEYILKLDGEPRYFFSLALNRTPSIFEPMNLFYLIIARIISAGVMARSGNASCLGGNESDSKLSTSG